MKALALGHQFSAMGTYSDGKRVERGPTIAEERSLICASIFIAFSCLLTLLKFFWITRRVNGFDVATKQYILIPTTMLERISISKWKVPMIAFAMTVTVAGYVRTSMVTARHEAEVKRQRKLNEIAAARRSKIAQLTP